jgi:hypothetical protein
MHLTTLCCSSLTFTGTFPSCRSSVSTKLASSPEYTNDVDCSYVAPSPPRPPLVLPCQPNKPIVSVMAPMVAASDYPFRVLLREHGGVDLLYTQMLHSKNFVNDANFRRWHCDFFECGMLYPDLLPTQQECLGGNDYINNARDFLASQLRKEPGPFAPLMVQLAGHEVDVVVQAALIICDQTKGKIAGIDLVSTQLHCYILRKNHCELKSFSSTYWSSELWMPAEHC